MPEVTPANIMNGAIFATRAPQPEYANITKPSVTNKIQMPIATR